MSEKDLGGRPPYEPTARDRRRVAVGKATGLTHEALADALDIHRDTLEKYFRYELTHGAAKRLLEIREAIAAKAKKGDVSAARLIAQWTAAAAVTDKSLEVVSGAQSGVKAQRNAAARTAEQGTAWQDCLPDHQTPQ